jgi:Asp-tRNA(Asn)/Glu-tRNA(Gln) amidotransferase A subunit family amidase
VATFYLSELWDADHELLESDPESVSADVTQTLVSLLNAAGTSCTAQPVPVARSKFPWSLQLVGPLGGEELLLATAEHLEATVA